MEVQTPKVIATLVLTFDDQGQVNAEGPLNNKLFCYGILDAAKDIVRNYHAKMAAARLVPAAGAVPGDDLTVLDPLAPRG